MSERLLRDAGELIGRILLGMLFVLEASHKLGAYGDAVRYTLAYGVPAQLLPAAIALELGGGIMLVAGWYTRVAALCLAAFCLTAALIFHTKFSDLNQLIHFEKDFALAGAFLVVWACGPRSFSVDAWRNGQRDAAC